MFKFLALTGVVIGVIVLVCVLSLLLAYPIKWCWNYTIPQIFGLIEITWGQAWCLSFLSTCLIKSTLLKKGE